MFTPIFSLSGGAGGGGGGGDMLAANNLSELTDPNQALLNLGGSTTGIAIFTAPSSIAIWDLITSNATDIASASTVNLQTATGEFVNITGVVTINAITLSDGNERWVRFSGILQLTNGASLLLPSAANITTAVGDVAGFRGYSAGVVRCFAYNRASGKALIPPAIGEVTGMAANVAQWAATPTSANLRLAVTDEVGAGPAMFTRTGVRRTVYIPASAMIPRVVNGAAPGVNETGTNKVLYDSMDFDQAVEEAVGFWFAPPSVWDSGTFTAKFHWTAASGAGNVKWDIAGRLYGDGETLDAALGSRATPASDTLITAGFMHVTVTSTALTVAASSMLPNRPIFFMVYRDVATDTLTADAKLLGITLEYTESITEPSGQ